MREHDCFQNPHRGVYVIDGSSIDEDESGGDWGNRWILRIDRIAREQDVIDGEAEQVGELLLRNEFVIDFCPFCGIYLERDLGMNDAPV